MRIIIIINACEGYQVISWGGNPSLSLFFETMGVVNITGSVKRDFIAIRDNVYLHKQIELRDGLLFMRMKKRPIVRV